MITPCGVKVFYDTEFEAERAASMTSHSLGNEMIHYKCGNHWHIANERRELRSRVRTENRTYCPLCHCYLKPGNWSKHKLVRAHVKREEADKQPLTRLDS